MLTPADLDRPLITAPMAGGPSTPALAAAAAEAGGLGFLAAGYKKPALLAEQIAATRAATDRPFGVNLFVPGPPADLGAAAAYRDLVAPLAAEHSVELREPRQDDDAFAEKVELLVADPVPVVSFTFGCPPADAVARLHAVGTSCWATVTSAEEARLAEEAGADALTVQGPGAGGHRAVFDPEAPAPTETLEALADAVRDATDLPIAVAGGLTSPEAVRAWTGRGIAVAAGTAFLDAAEAGSSPLLRRSLHDPRFTRTAITRAFSGRLARGLVNAFMERFSEAAPASYPAVNGVLGPLKTAGWIAEDPDLVSLWAGTGWQDAVSGTTAEIYERLLG